MHAHIKATESVILMLSLSTGSGTLPPRPHTHAIAQAAVTRSTRHIHRHNHRIRITRYISRTPSSRHAHGVSTHHNSHNRKDQHGAHRTIVTRRGVAGVSELIGEAEGKGMEQEGEERSIADAARESRQNEERAAGPAAQFTHHETASTQGRHTTPAATHHAGGEDIHHHLPQIIPAAPRKWPQPAPTTLVTRGASHPQERRLGLRTPSPSSSSSWPRRKTTAATRNRQHT
ncbi:hypothetical protein TcCL_Unassigned00597, partial [Trypanosoma cruzi]